MHLLSRFGIKGGPSGSCWPRAAGLQPCPGLPQAWTDREHGWSCQCAGAERGRCSVGRPGGQESTLSQNEGFPVPWRLVPRGFQQLIAGRLLYNRASEWPMARDSA